MNTNIQSALQFLRNKAVAIAFTVLMAVVYIGLQAPTGKPLPFTEVLYAVVLLSAVSVIAPLVRLLIFPEAAAYAESGKLREDMASTTRSNGLTHYWFATALCWLSTVAAITSLI